MPWYDGPTVLEMLDRFERRAAAAGPPVPHARAGRLQVHELRRRSAHRRGHRGERDARSRATSWCSIPPASGRACSRSRRSAAPTRAGAAAGEAAGFTLEQQIYASRGEIAARADQPPPQVTHAAAGQPFLARPGAARAAEGLHAAARHGARADAARGDPSRHRCLGPGRGGRARDGRAPRGRGVHAEAQRAVAFDLRRRSARRPAGSSSSTTSRSAAAASCARRCPTARSRLRDKVLLRNAKWESSHIAPSGGPSATASVRHCCFITGESSTDRKGLAKATRGPAVRRRAAIVYFLGMGNVLYGVDADIERGQAQRARSTSGGWPRSPT